MSCMECPTCGCPEVCDCDRPNSRCSKSPLDLLTAESEFVRADALQQKCDKQERDLDATVTLLRSVVNDETWQKLNLTEAGKQYDMLVAERDALRKALAEAKGAIRHKLTCSLFRLQNPTNECDCGAMQPQARAVEGGDGTAG